MSNWTPITLSLPEAGLPVLVYVINAHGNPKMTRRLRASYAPRHTLEPDTEGDWHEYDEGSDTYYLPEGWYESNEFDETNWYIKGDVTHWMPLPEPPPEKPT